MVQAYVIIVTLVLALVVHAEIQEPGLKQFCRHVSLDIPGGLNAQERAQENNICQQKLPYSLVGREASNLCRYFAPFVVADVIAKDGSVTCKWKSPTTCKDDKSILIKGRCFYLGLSAKYSKAKDRCSRGGKVHRVVNPDEARWISILLPSEEPIYISNRKDDTSSDMMENDAIWDGREFSVEPTRVKSLALLMRHNSISEKSAGKIIKVKETLMLRVLCSTHAVNYKGSGNMGTVSNPSGGAGSAVASGTAGGTGNGGSSGSGSGTGSITGSATSSGAGSAGSAHGPGSSGSLGGSGSGTGGGTGSAGSAGGSGSGADGGTGSAAGSGFGSNSGGGGMEEPLIVPHGVLTTNNKKVLVTNNVYQPTANSSIEINTQHFHDICRAICENCFAALPGMTTELSDANDISYVPARHANKNILENGKCTKYTFSNVLKNSFQQQNNGKAGDIEKSSWESTYPDNMCADTLRTAVVSQRNGKIKDSPAITRHRITCVMGEAPDAELFSLCRQNSISDGNGGCRCLDGFQDITNTTLKQAQDFAKGQLCVPKNPCKTMIEPMVIDFLVDSSQSLGIGGWDALVQFLLTAGPQLPANAKIGITQFSGLEEDHDIIRHWWLKDGWTVNDFNKQVLRMEYIEGWTPIWAAVVRVHQEFKKVQATKKLAILITDGQATGYDPLQEINAFRKETDARFVVVPIGPYLKQEYLRTMKTWVADENEDYIDLTKQGFDKLTKEHMRIIMETVCDEYTWKIFEDALDNM